MRMYEFERRPDLKDRGISGKMSVKTGRSPF
jgi:hypothetical protein